MAAPRVSQMGGGIQRDKVGASTAAYEQYFDGHGGAGAEAGNAERTGNYADVVNKCVARVSAHTSGQPVGRDRRGPGAAAARVMVRRWISLPPWRATQLTFLGPPGRSPPRYYDLATSFYEYGWVSGPAHSTPCWLAARCCTARAACGLPVFARPPASRPTPHLAPHSLPSPHRADILHPPPQGHSFHFAHRYKTETLQQSLTRHEHYLALRLQLHPGSKALDLGCGVGGPLRCVAAFSGAHVTGVNNNDHQLQRAEALTAATWGPSHVGTCRYVKGDFMDLKALGLGAYDAAYQIEATCHAPDLVGVYTQIFNALKPGGLFASYEWCTTADFDDGNPQHVRVKHDILKGNGLPDLRSTSAVLEALTAVGFEVLDAEDIASRSEIPWYAPLDCSHSALTATFSRSGGGFRTSALGRAVTRRAVYVLETLRIAPKGTCAVSAFLEAGADALVAGGKQGIFTPMFFTLVRKPALPGAARGAAAAAPAGHRSASDVFTAPVSQSRGGQGALSPAREAGEEVGSGAAAGATPTRRSSRRTGA